MRVTSIFLSILLLTGCLSVPRDAHVLDSRGEQYLDVDSCSPAPGLVADVSGLDASDFSVASWNLFKQRRPGWYSDLVDLGAGSDLLLLQEASMVPELNTLLLDTYAAWEMTPAFHYRDVAHGVTLAGRYPAAGRCSHLQTEPWLRIPKAVVAAYYPIAGFDANLLVINVHAVNFTLGVESYRRQLAAVADLAGDHPGPLVIAGDFNSWSTNRELVLQDFADTLGLDRVRFLEQEPSRHFGSIVDHVYYRGLAVLDAEARAVTSSDHFPLIVRFAVTHNG